METPETVPTPVPDIPEKKTDAVFEGGGVKGIGLVGSVYVTEQAGYSFQNIAGTSAGAIVAALVAAGYRSDDLRKILQDLDYQKFKDRGLLDRIPLLGPAISVIFEKGIFEGKFFENWLRDLLEHAPNGPVRTFKDLHVPGESHLRYRYRLQVIASDLSRGKMLILPRDIADYGFQPDELDVARAVRMSMSIPFFYEPVRIPNVHGKDHFIVDGGILSNYPIWIFDDGSQNPPWPTLGYKLVEPDNGRPNPIRGPITMFSAMFSTMMEAHDERYIKDKDFVRTVPIKTLGVRTTDFSLSKAKSQTLFDSGVAAAEDFFNRWDFDEYKREYRTFDDESRRLRLAEQLNNAK